MEILLWEPIIVTNAQSFGNAGIFATSFREKSRRVKFISSASSVISVKLFEEILSSVSAVHDASAETLAKLLFPRFK